MTWRSKRGVTGYLSFRSDPDTRSVVARRDAGNELLRLEYSTCHFGGVRPWFACGGCGARRVVLYDTGTRFRCRGCLNTVYQTQRLVRCERLLMKARRLSKRLGGDGAEYELPDKPPRMHWTTYERLAARYLVAYRAGMRAWSEDLDALGFALGKRPR